MYYHLFILMKQKFKKIEAMEEKNKFHKQFRKGTVNLLSLLLFLIVASPAIAQDTFSAWDNDNDGYIEMEEFTDTYISTFYDDWDLTAADELGIDDFYTTTFSIIDTDDDDFLDEEEWDFGYDYYYGDYLNDDFDLFDTDDDELVVYTEYNDSLYDSDFFYDWDTDNDGYISEYELAENVFQNWDINDNGLLNRSEYLAFDRQYTKF